MVRNDLARTVLNLADRVFLMVGETSLWRRRVVGFECWFGHLEDVDSSLVLNSLISVSLLSVRT